MRLQSYYYRVRPPNTITQSLSQPVAMTGSVDTIKADSTVWSINQVATDPKEVRIRHAVTIPPQDEAKTNRLLYEPSVALKQENGARLVLNKILLQIIFNQDLISL